MVWQALIAPVSNIVGGYLKNKHEQSQAKHKAKMQVIKNDADWESKMAAASANSWKDEFWTIIFGGILVCCFIPYTQEYVKEGFIFLDESCPQWFQTCLYIVIGSSFGYRFGKQGLQFLNKKTDGKKKN